MRLGPLIVTLFVAMSVGKSLALQLQQLRSAFGAGPRAFSDGGEIADHMGLADLASLVGEVVVDREAIAHHNPAQGVPEQLNSGSRPATQSLDEHCHHGGDQDPLPAPVSRGIVAHRFAKDCTYGIAGGGAGFIDLGHLLLTSQCQGLLHGLLQRGAAASGAAGTHQPEQPLLNQQRRDWRNRDHLSRQGGGSSIFTLGQGATSAAGMVWCSTTSSTRSIGSSFGPDPGWPGCPPRLRPLAFRRSGG